MKFRARYDAFLRQVTRWVAMIGLARLVGLTLATIPDVLMRWLFNSPIEGVHDLYKLVIAGAGWRWRPIGGCAGFGAVCGSSLATAATMGRVALPEMIDRGYSPTLASGSVAAGGTLGMLIPPSVIMVICAFLTEQLVITLFVAALIPGLIAVLFQFFTVAVLVRANPEAGPAGRRLDWAKRWRVLVQGWSVLVLMLTVVGGIYGGVFTVNEAAALGAALAFLFTVMRGKLTRETVFQVLKETATNTAMIYLIIGGASIFSAFVPLSRMPDEPVGLIAGAGVAPLVVILILFAVYLVLGAVFDTVAAMVITLPFVLFGVARNIPLKTIFRGILPFFYADIVRILLIILFPATALWLPQLLGYNIGL